MVSLFLPITLVTSFMALEGSVPESLVERFVWAGPSPAEVEQKGVGQAKVEGEITREGQEPLDLNTCSYSDLLQLPGIGPKKAKAILEEREKRPFRSVSDLARVKGIGPKTVKRLAPYLTVGRSKRGE